MPYGEVSEELRGCRRLMAELVYYRRHSFARQTARQCLTGRSLEYVKSFLNTKSTLLVTICMQPPEGFVLSLKVNSTYYARNARYMLVKSLTKRLDAVVQHSAVVQRISRA